MNLWQVTPWFPTLASPVGGIFIREWLRLGSRVGPQSLLHFNRVSWRALWETRFRILKEGGKGSDQGIPFWRCDRIEPLPKRPACRAGVAFAASVPKEMDRWIGAFGKPDLVIAHNVQIGGQVALEIKRRTGTPFLVVEHSGPFSATLKTPAAQGVFKEVTQEAGCLVAVSERQRNDILAFDPGCGVEVLANPLRQPEEEEGNRSKENGIRLLSVGMLSADKGYDLLIDAVARFRTSFPEIPLQVHIAGGGNDLESLVSLARERNVQDVVTFTGMLSRDEVEAEYRWCNLYVQSSRVESFCIAAADALMRGIPSIITRCGGPEMFAAPAGARMIPAGDSPALADAIGDFASGAWTFDAEGARDYMESRYGEAAFVRGFGNLCRAVISKA